MTKRMKFTLIFFGGILSVFVLKTTVLALLSHEIENKIREKMPSRSVVLSGLDFGILHPQVYIERFQLLQNGVSLAEVEDLNLNLGRWTDLKNVIDGKPEKIEMQANLQSAKIHRDLLPEKIRRALEIMEMSEVTAKFNLNVSAQVSENQVRVKEFFIDLQEFMTLTMSIDFKNVDLRSILIQKKDTQDLSKLLDELTLKNLKIEYFDKSIIARMAAIQTFPEFSPAEKVDKTQREPITISEATNQSLLKFLTEYMVQPQPLHIQQSNDSEIEPIKLLKSLQSNQIELADFLRKYGLSVAIEGRTLLAE